MMREKDAKFSLREVKYAKLKLKVLSHFVEKIKDAPIEDISIKKMCHELEIAERTFYNYFPKKVDLCIYFIQLTLIELNFDLMKDQKLDFGKSALKIVFHTLGKHLGQKESLLAFYRIHAMWLSEYKNKINFENITPAEIHFRFPEQYKTIYRPGMKFYAISEILKNCLLGMRKCDDISSTEDIGTYMDLFMGMYLGQLTSAPLCKNNPFMKKNVDFQLSTVFKGLGI